MDILSELLGTLKFSGSVFLQGDFSAPWSLEAPPAEEIPASVIPDIKKDHILILHVPIQGQCWIETPGHSPLHVQTGDVVVLRGGAHTLCHSPGCASVPITEIMPRTPSAAPPVVVYGNGGDKTHLVCGYLKFVETSFNPLLPALPDVIHVSSSELAPANWVELTLRYFIQEARSGRPGGRSVLKRLTELLFIETIRHYMEKQPNTECNWLSALGDPVVGRALQLLHEDPSRAWTVDSLAKQAAISRSGLATRFSHLLGEPPMHYLSRWRIHLASRFLQENGGGVSAAADCVGYDSESAFKRAFKRHMGQSPAAWLKKTPIS
jgi:AraC-like DNA-binding protein